MRFDVLTIDPPWPEKRNPDNRMGDAGSHWDFLSLDDLIDIPVESVMADVCAVLLWSTYRHVFVVGKLVEGWNKRLPRKRRLRLIGRGFTWIKINSGMARWGTKKLARMLSDEGVLRFIERMSVYGTGYYTAGNDEIALLYMSGSRSVPVVDKSVRSLGCLPRPTDRTFSAKPDEFRDRTIRLFGLDARYLEVFATVEYEKRGVEWNNQGWMIDGRDIRCAIADLGQKERGEK